MKLEARVLSMYVWMYVCMCVYTHTYRYTERENFTSITILSISQISMRSTDRWRDISLKTPPSPPPITKTCSINKAKKWLEPLKLF